MDVNRFDPNYPPRYPQDIPRWRRAAMWVIIVLAIADVAYVGTRFVAHPGNVVFAMFGVVVMLLAAAAASFALYPLRSLNLKDFALKCSNFALSIFGVGLAVSVGATVGELYLW